jgi:hypothetical protein
MMVDSEAKIEQEFEITGCIIADHRLHHNDTHEGQKDHIQPWGPSDHHSTGLIYANDTSMSQPVGEQKNCTRTSGWLQSGTASRS